MRHKTRIGAIAAAILVIVGLKLAYDRHGREDVDTAVPSRPAGLLGSAIDVAMGTDGSVYLADSARQVVRVLDSQLRQRGEVSSPDSSVERFRGIQAVRATENARFAVLDRTLRRIDVFEWKNGAGRRVSTTPLEFEAYDFCPRADGSFVVLGNYKGTRVHRVDVRGTMTESSAPVDTGLLHVLITKEGAPFTARLGDMLSGFVMDGNIACLGDSDIVLTSRTVPTFEVYKGASVATMVRTRIDSMWPVTRIDIETRLLDGGKASVSFAAGAAGYHTPMRAVAAPGGFLIATPLARVPVKTQPGSDQPDSVRVFEFSSTAAGVQRRFGVAGELRPLASATFLAVQPEQGRAGRLHTLRYSELADRRRASTEDSLKGGVIASKR